MTKKIIITLIFIYPILVFSQVTASFSTLANKNNYCTTDTIFFKNSSTGASLIYHWEFGDNTDTWAKEPYHIYTKSGTFTVKLTVTNNTGAEHSTTAEFVISETPEITLTDDISFSKITVVSTQTDLTYVWSFNNQDISQSGSELFYLESGIYTVRVTNSNSCSSKKSINVTIGNTGTTVDDSLRIIVSNNILTPDIKDGANDVMFIEGLNGYKFPCIVTIYNKWGQLIYNNNSYSNTDGFRGIDNNGRNLDAGTYYYIIKNKNRKTATGYIDLIR